jgi:hypothetical protein
MTESKYATYEQNGIYSMMINGLIYRSVIPFGENPEKYLIKSSK